MGSRDLLLRCRVGWGVVGARAPQRGRWPPTNHQHTIRLRLLARQAARSQDRPPLPWPPLTQGPKGHAMHRIDKARSSASCSGMGRVRSSGAASTPQSEQDQKSSRRSSCPVPFCGPVRPSRGKPRRIHPWQGAPHLTHTRPHIHAHSPPFFPPVTHPQGFPQPDAARPLISSNPLNPQQHPKTQAPPLHMPPCPAAAATAVRRGEGGTGASTALAAAAPPPPSPATC